MLYWNCNICIVFFMETNRKHQRYSLNGNHLQNAEIKLGDNAYPAEILNISRGGTLVKTPVDIPFGAAVTLSFSLPGLLAPCRIPCVVRWVNKENGIGLQFLRLRAIEVWGLNRFLRWLEPLNV